MKTDFKYPESYHTEYHEDTRAGSLMFIPETHPGYEYVMCRYCNCRYLEAKGVAHAYDCGDSLLHHNKRPG